MPRKLGSCLELTYHDWDILKRNVNVYEPIEEGGT